jgi:regulator of protease activity HflC (stomatin/prohibitin superfamily)
MANIRTVMGSMNLDELLSERDERHANVLEAEGFKLAAMLKAKAEKRAVILAAEARREARFRAAAARERQAEAKAKATEAVSKAIGRGSMQAINYFVARRYIDAIGRLARSPNQRVILMPLESASTIGSLAGIAELACESFGVPGASAAAIAGGREGR